MIKRNIITTASFALLAFSTLNPSLAADTVAVYDLHGPIPENGVSEPSLFSLMGSPEQPITHYDLVERLNYAVSDEEVKAIVLDIDDTGLGYAQLQEVRRLLKKARENKKDVWLYAKSFNLATATLGSIANHFNVMPESGSTFHGLHSESMYVKGMLDKVGVKMDVGHIGDFQSAGEHF